MIIYLAVALLLVSSIFLGYVIYIVAFQSTETQKQTTTPESIPISTVKFSISFKSSSPISETDIKNGIAKIFNISSSDVKATIVTNLNRRNSFKVVQSIKVDIVINIAKRESYIKDVITNGSLAKSIAEATNNTISDLSLIIGSFVINPIQYPTTTGMPTTTMYNTTTGIPTTTMYNTTTGMPTTTMYNTTTGIPTTTMYNTTTGMPTTTMYNTTTTLAPAPTVATVTIPSTSPYFSLDTSGTTFAGMLGATAINTYVYLGDMKTGSIPSIIVTIKDFKCTYRDVDGYEQQANGKFYVNITDASGNTTYDRQICSVNTNNIMTFVPEHKTGSQDGICFSDHPNIYIPSNLSPYKFNIKVEVEVNTTRGDMNPDSSFNFAAYFN